MALEQGLITISLEAGEDLDSYQHYAVGLNSSGEMILADGDEVCFIGILQGKPKDTEAGAVAIGGITKAVLGGSVSVGDPLKPDGSAGKLVEQTSGESVGRVLKIDGVSGQIATVLLRTETI